MLGGDKARKGNPKIFDPNNILNPGKVFDVASSK